MSISKVSAMVFESVIPLRWGDMDAMGHVNNTVYFRLIEEARMQWFSYMDLSKMLDGEGPILAHAACDFLKPLIYPATTKVIQRLVRLGRSSVDLESVIECVDQAGVTYARGKSVVVWMDYKNGKSVAWPKHVRALFE